MHQACFKLSGWVSSQRHLRIRYNRRLAHADSADVAGASRSQSLVLPDRSMGDARAAASSSEDAAATVAPLVALWKRSTEMFSKQRWARSLELMERALEQARQTLPQDNLVAVWMNGFVVVQRMISGSELASITAPRPDGSLKFSASTSDAHFLTAMMCERLAACCARFKAGTLSTPTPEEVAFFSTCKQLDAAPEGRVGEELLFISTTETLDWTGSDCEVLAGLKACGVSAMLQIALSLDARGELEPWLRKRDKTHSCLARVLAGVLASNTERAQNHLCVFLPPEAEVSRSRLEALHRTLPNISGGHEPLSDISVSALVAQLQGTAAADVARHGLRTCTLPGCGAKEPHPRFFKCCSRCRSVFYCSSEHQREDWPRHRAADQCTKPASS